MIDFKPRPLIVLVSAPSGAGKTTLCERLLARQPQMIYSISCTTRPPRAGEVNGLHYHFLPEEEFTRRVQAGEFLEHAQVYGAWYGTLQSTVRESLQTGRDVLMDLDVQGADTLRRYLRALPVEDPLRRGFVDIFIAPPSLDDLRRRLVGRGKDSAEVIERRMSNAAKEMACWRNYQYLLINDELDAALERFNAIILAERQRVLC